MLAHKDAQLQVEDVALKFVEGICTLQAKFVYALLNETLERKKTNVDCIMYDITWSSVIMVSGLYHSSVRCCPE